MSSSSTTSPVKLFLVSLVLLATVSQTHATCNLLALKFRLFGCATAVRFGCRLIDAKMRLLGCKQFACEGYRNDLDTFCTLSCRDLEIRNGICRFGTRCCLNSDFSFESNSNSFGSNSNSFEILEPIPGSDAFNLNLPGMSEREPVVN